MMSKSEVVSTQVTSATLHLHVQAATTPPSPSRHYCPDSSPAPIYRPKKDGQLGELGHYVRTLPLPQVITQLNSKARERNYHRLSRPRPTQCQ